MSDYRLQIIHINTGRVVSWAPGRLAETDVIEDLLARVKAKGVGLGRSEASVIGRIREAFGEMLYELKSKVR